MSDQTFAFRMHEVTRYLPGFKLHVDDFSLPEGYIVGLVGPNGAGKSTLIKTLLNLVHADFGTVEVLGRSQPEAEIDIKHQVGYVSDEPTFYEKETVAWTIRFISQYYPTWDDDECRRLLRKWEIDPNKRVKELSRGTKVKLALTLALAQRPTLLLLDEPNTGVDPVSRQAILEEIVHFMQGEGRSVLFSSHITSDVEQIADYVALMHNGHIVEWDEKDALLQRWRRVSGYLPMASHGDDSNGASGPAPKPVPAPESGQKLGREPTEEPGLARKFHSYRREGRRFTGLTGSYSESWRSALEARGCTDLEVARVDLEDILIAHVRGEAS